MSEPQNARSGFFSDAEFGRVHAELPEALQPFTAFLFLTGWRVGEAMGLEWRAVDFAAGTVRLDGANTKNKQPRALPFNALPALAELLRRQRDATTALEREQGRIIACVFHRGGRPIHSYNRAWRDACDRAGLAGKLVHDFRRTAVRRLERAGVPRSQAMKLVGHRTQSIYARYGVVAESDLREALGKVAVQLAADRSVPEAVVPILAATNTTTEPLPATPVAARGGRSVARKSL